MKHYLLSERHIKAWVIHNIFFLLWKSVIDRKKCYLFAAFSLHYFFLPVSSGLKCKSRPQFVAHYSFKHLKGDYYNMNLRVLIYFAWFACSFSDKLWWLGITKLHYIRGRVYTHQMSWKKLIKWDEFIAFFHQPYTGFVDAWQLNYILNLSTFVIIMWLVVTFSIQTSNKDGYGNHNITRWFVKSHCEGLSLDLLV